MRDEKTGLEVDTSDETARVWAALQAYPAEQELGVNELLAVAREAGVALTQVFFSAGELWRLGKVRPCWDTEDLILQRVVGQP